MAVFEKLQEIIVELGKDAEEVKVKACFYDELDADSLDVFQKVLSQKSKMSSMSKSKLKKVLPVGDLVAYVKEKLNIGRGHRE